MRLPLSTLEAFNAVARNQSLRGAADSLGVKPSTISHQLKTLEEKLGTSVFIRTTRSVKLTEAGSMLYEGTKPAFSQLSVAYESARSSATSSNGALKLEVSDLVYDILIGPGLTQFCARYPELAVELSISDGLSDLVEDGMHAGIRKGCVIGPDMVSIELMQSLSLGVFASPEYLRVHGTPKHPHELLEHGCIRYRYPTTKRIEEWEFTNGQGTNGLGTNGHCVERQAVSGRLITSTRSSQVDLCLKGLGLIYTLRDYCAEQINRGELVSLMEDSLPEPTSIYIYFPKEYQSMEPLRLLLEFLDVKLDS